MSDTIQTSAKVFQEVIPGELLREQRAECGDDVFVQILSRRRCQENIVIPAVPEPLIVWIVSGEAIVEERAPGGAWMANRIVEGDFFLTTATEPTEMRWQAAGTSDFQVMHVYVGVKLLRQSIREVHGKPIRSFALREVSGEKDGILSSLLDHIKLELSGHDEPNNAYIQGIAKALTIHLVRTYQTAFATERGPRGGLQAYKLHRIFDAMRRDLVEPFVLSRYAALAELSDYHFSRVFRQSTGMAPSSYFIHLRLEQAKEWLMDSEQSIIDICVAVGYASPSHFSTLFRADTGMTPSEYREIHRQSRRSHPPPVTFLEK
jgi:AraC family transcriptional regulator